MAPEALAWQEECSTTGIGGFSSAGVRVRREGGVVTNGRPKNCQVVWVLSHMHPNQNPKDV